MKKIFGLIMAGALLLAACGTPQAESPAAPATEPTPLVITTPIQQADTPTPVIVAPTAERAFVPPTPVVGNSTIYLGGELPSTIFVTVDGIGYGCLNDKCQYEQTLGEDLPENVMYALFFSPRENENTIAFIGGNPSKVWIDNGGILTCTSPCQGEFELMNSYRYDSGLMSLAEAGQNAAKDAIKFWREAADNGNACLPSGKAIGHLSYCFRSLATPTP